MRPARDPLSTDEGEDDVCAWCGEAIGDVDPIVADYGATVWHPICHETKRAQDDEADEVACENSDVSSAGQS